MTHNPLGIFGLRFFERRGINPETAARYGVYTGSRTADKAVIPNEAGTLLVFPYVEGGRMVNEKYRTPDKKFWQREGGRSTFWNAEVLDDSMLQDGVTPLIITEGEIDCLTLLDCGLSFSVSVPEGAPSVKDGEDPAQLEPADVDGERAGKFRFVWNNRHLLKKIKRFILAVDSDPPGQRLAAELVRRLGAARCSFVNYPEGCKDFNDVLMKHGVDGVIGVLNSARPYPVRGLYRLSDYPDLPPPPMYSTGWWTFDRHLKLFPGEFMVVTGIPGHGKSSWVFNLLANLAAQYDWRSAIFSPEMATVPYLRDKLRLIRGGAADAFIEEHFCFIDADPTGRDDEDFNLDWIIDRATDAVLRYGIRVLVIDPWNEVEHARERNESETDYIGRSIRALKRFARLHEVAVIVVAHPTKEIFRDGKRRAISLYDISGSSHWYNKCDHGIVIDRPDPFTDEAVITVAKVRFDASGLKGEVRLRYDVATCRYLTLEDK